MARTEAQSLRQRIGNHASERFLWDRAASARITDLAGGTALGGRLDELTGKSVLVATGGQLATALALIELAGVARRLSFLPPDGDPELFASVIAGAEINAVVVDRDSTLNGALDVPLQVPCAAEIAVGAKLPAASRETEWVLLTSGTTGAPKMAVHSLAGLTAPIGRQSASGPAVWGTFYDIRRY